MNIESSYYKEILGKLRRLVKREYSLIAAIGIQAAIIIGISIFFSFSFLELLGSFSSDIRTIFFFIFILITIAAVALFVIYPLLKYFNVLGRIEYNSAAEKVGKNFPEIKDDLQNAMQLISIDKGRNYSIKLIDAAFFQVYNKTKPIKFESSINFDKAKQLLFYTIGVVVFCGLMFLFIPSLNAASNRLINFNQEFIPPPKFSFEISPGNAEITRGDNIDITAEVLGALPREVFINTKSAEQAEFTSQKMERDSNGIYNYKLSAVRLSYDYYVSAEDIGSEEFKISVIDRPVIKTLDLSIAPPAYSKLPRIEQKDNGNITSLIGSNVELKLSSTKELKDAKLVFADSSEHQLELNSTEASAKFRVKGDNTYQIILTDEDNNKNLFPITYSIKALNDAYPIIDMIVPNSNTDLSNDNRLPFELKIADDYGFSKLTLNYRLSASKYEESQNEFKSLEIPVEKNLKESDINYVWNLSQLNLGAQDVVTYYLEIFDNDNVSGPKSSKTSTFNVRVPSLDEILAKADETHSQVEKELQQTLKEAEDLKKNLEKIDQELKKDQKQLTWEEKEKIEKALDKFEELQEKVDEMNESLDKMKDDLAENNLLSKETLEKYMELQEMMDQLTSEEMKKAMEQMRNLLKNLNRQQAQDQMKDLKIDEEKFQKSIERTLNLLKRIQIEQKVDELLKRTEQMTEKQEDLQKQTSEKDLSNKNEKKELSDKQKRMSEDLENLEEEMSELSEKMENLDDMPKEEMEKMLEEFEKQQNQELSKEAMEKIQQQQKQQAMQQQKQLSQNMKSMNQMMQQMQQQMQQQNQMQTFTDMMKILDNLLTLSKQQEELRKQSEQYEPNSSSFNENSQKQDNLQRSLDKILNQMSSLSQKTFAITPEMGKALGDAKREMNKSIQAMQNRNGSMASNSQGESMKSLNEAASLMKGSMESMMQGNGQGGMMSLMQQLGQLSRQQMGLNNMTQMLQQMQQGEGLSPDQQSQLQKLSQQQSVIQKSIDQLNKEARQSGKSKTLPGNLENIVKEMQEVITDMNTQKLNDELVQKQEKILSRMLDAQRSINERDFEKKRESNTGENIVRQSPGDLNFNTEKGKDKIKDELNKAIQEGYTRDYENLIRKYYETLQKENVNR